MSHRSQVIADLRASINGIEKRAGFGEAGRAGTVATLPGGMPRVGAGTLSELFTDTTRDAGAGFGFALMQARGALSAERPVVLFLQMRAEAQETGLPYGPGLLRFGFDPQALAVVRTGTIAELLWAMEEAAGCCNVAAVIGDVGRGHTKLDFTASRRLSLRAESFSAMLMLLRSGTNREASAAVFRFHVAALLSAETPFDARAPGAMRCRVTLEKGARQGTRHGAGSGGQDALGQDFWDLRWSENGLVADGALPGVGQPRSGTGGAKALSGADAAGLADRLSQTA